MSLDFFRAKRFISGIAGVAILISTTGCSAKRYVPRILSEAVVVRDGAKPADPTAAVPGDGESRVGPQAPPATKLAAGKSPRAKRGAVGTIGAREIGWSEALELMASAAETAAASQPPVKPAGPVPATGAAAPRAALASTGDGSWFLVIALIGCAMGAFIYRYRVY